MLAAAALGCLVWNRPPARIFLGDVGSIPLGFLLGGLLLREAAAGLWAAGLAELPGSDGRKVAIATVIWQKTTMKMQWIAERLSMRSAANASQQIRRYRLAPKPLPKALERWTNQSSDVA